MDALKTVWQQFLKDSDKLPGWVPLFVVVLLALAWAAPPEHIVLAGRTIPLSPEFLAAAVTLLLYTAGDAIDEFVFKTGAGAKRGTRDVYRRRYRDELQDVSETIGVGRGVYPVALKLVTAGEKQRAKWSIHIPNEAAKCLRALILPLVLVAAVLVWERRIPLAAASLAGSVVLLFLYPQLKVDHIRRLYRAARTLADHEDYHDEELGAIRLVFWEGSFVASGPRIAKRSRSIAANPGTVDAAVRV